MTIDRGLLPQGSRVLCAVSGGADSMCLLHYLHENAGDLGITVCAAHLNHGIRGSEADRDMHFVGSFCAERDIPLVTEKLSVPDFAEEKGLGIEEAARSLRYDFLQRAAKTQNCGLIATAHNSDDNAETMLFNLVRGSGLRGLCGIPRKRDCFIRPLLDTPRADIESYCEEKAVPYVTDSTNLSDEYTRNLIRHKVLPVLREINPAASETLLRASDILKRDEEYLSELAESFIEENYSDNSLPAGKLRELPYPVKARVLRRLCGRGLSQKNTEDILRLLEAEGLAYLDIHGRRLCLDRGRLFFKSEAVRIEDTELRLGERLFVGDYEIESSLVETVCLHDESFHNLYFNYDAICGKISFTSRRDGDKIRLKGRCTKSLKELFREAGMTQGERECCPVLRDERGIIAVMGFGVAERCAARDAEKLLKITIKKKVRFRRIANAD